MEEGVGIVKYRILRRRGTYYVQRKWLFLWHTEQMQMMFGTHDIEFDTEKAARKWMRDIQVRKADKGTVIGEGK